MNTEIQTVTAFKTSDGRVFEDEATALDWQNMLDFDASVDADYGNPGSGADMREWLEKNQTLVEKYYSSPRLVDSKSKRAEAEAIKNKRNGIR
jgi:hypothetical protein